MRTLTKPLMCAVVGDLVTPSQCSTPHLSRPEEEPRAPGPRAHSPYGTQSRIINIGEQSKPTKMTGWPGQTEAAEVVVTSMATKHFRCHSILPRTKGCCLPVIFLKSGHSEKERLPNKQG